MPSNGGSGYGWREEDCPWLPYILWYHGVWSQYHRVEIKWSDSLKEVVVPYDCVHQLSKSLDISGRHLSDRRLQVSYLSGFTDLVLTRFIVRVIQWPVFTYDTVPDWGKRLAGTRHCLKKYYRGPNVSPAMVMAQHFSLKLVFLTRQEQTCLQWSVSLVDRLPSPCLLHHYAQ